MKKKGGNPDKKRSKDNKRKNVKEIDFNITTVRNVDKILKGVNKDESN